MVSRAGHTQQLLPQSDSIEGLKKLLPVTLLRSMYCAGSSFGGAHIVFERVSTYTIHIYRSPAR